jgi:DegT/DnrJ/EryC1/StrS aminotransferase family
MGERRQRTREKIASELAETAAAAGDAAVSTGRPLCDEFVGKVLASESVAFFGSGTSAFSFLLDRCGLPDDAVILIPSFTCEKLLLPLFSQNRRFRLVDNHPNWVTPELDQYEAAYCEKTAAIVLIYIWGYVPRRVEAIIDWAKRKGLLVIEDVATAFGLSINGNPLGTLGDYAFGSFGYDKTWELGGGGFCLGSNMQGEPRGRGVSQIPSWYNSLIKLGRRTTVFRARHLLLRAIALKAHGQLMPATEIRARIQKAVSRVPESFVAPMMRRLENTRKFLATARQLRGPQMPDNGLFVPNNDQGVGVRLLARFEDRDEIIRELRRDNIWVGTDYAYPLEHWVHQGSTPNGQTLARYILSLISNERNESVDRCVKKLGEWSSYAID